MDTGSYKSLFLSEARDRIGDGFALIELLREGAGDETVRDLLRQAHSLKGMAATMGYEPIVGLAHALEDLLERLGAGSRELAPPLTLLSETLACLGTMIDEVEQGPCVAPPRAATLRHRLTGARLDVATPAPSADDSEDGAATDEASEPTISVYRVLLDLAEANPVDGGDPTVRVLGNLASLGKVIRVHPPQMTVETGRFNRFLQVILESHLDAEALQEILRCDTGILELAVQPSDERSDPEPTTDTEDPRWVRVRCDLLDRALDSSLETLVSLHRDQGEGPGRQDRSRRIGRATYELLRELRMVPLESIFGRLRQTALEAAASVEKQVELSIEDEGTRLDRALLDPLVDPLIHMVRNAVDHGIESAEARRAAGKPETGSLQLRIARIGERVRIELQDDGRGIDHAGIRVAAVSRGWYDRDSADRLSEAECRKLLCRPGFSTRTEPGTLSGRGMGMDIVRRNVEAIGGYLTIDCPQVGTCMTLDLPLSQSLVRSLLIASGGERFAVPARTVRTVRGDSDESSESGGTGCTLELETEYGTLDYRVDEVIDERDLIVHPLGPPLRRLRQFAGAAILEDGSIVLVLDPAALPPTHTGVTPRGSA